MKIVLSLLSVMIAFSASAKDNCPNFTDYSSQCYEISSHDREAQMGCFRQKAREFKVKVDPWASGLSTVYKIRESELISSGCLLLPDSTVALAQIKHKCRKQVDDRFQKNLNKLWAQHPHFRGCQRLILCEFPFENGSCFPPNS